MSHNAFNNMTNHVTVSTAGEVHQGRHLGVRPGEDILEGVLPDTQAQSLAGEPSPGGTRIPDETGADTPGRAARPTEVQPLADTGQGMVQQRRRAPQTDHLLRRTAVACAGLRRMGRREAGWLS